MTHARGAMRRNSHAIEREKSPRVSKVKSLCTHEFAMWAFAPCQDPTEWEQLHRQFHCAWWLRGHAINLNCSRTTIEHYKKVAAEAALVLLLASEIDSDSGPDDSDVDV